MSIKSKFPLKILLIFLVIICLLLLWRQNGYHKQYTQGQIVWSKYNQNIKEDLGRAIEYKVSQMKLKENTYFNGSITANEQWGVIALGETSTISQETDQRTGIFTLLAKRTNKGWEIVSPEDNNFCSVLNELPENILTQDGKDYFLCK